MVQRVAEAEWRGGLQDGAGTMRFGSGAFQGAYSFSSRFPLAYSLSAHSTNLPSCTT